MSTSDETQPEQQPPPGGYLPAPQAAKKSRTPGALGRADEAPNFLVRILCRKILAREPTSELSDESTAGEPDPTGVAALLAIATDAVSDERERGRALDSKTASLAGFSGVILSVNGLLAGPVFSRKLGSIGGPLAKICLVAAVVSLLLAVLVSILGVLMPQRYRGMGREQIRNFSSRSVQTHNEMWVHQSMLGALANILGQDRPVNDCKAHLTKIVAGLLAVAFVFVAGEAITLVTQHVSI